MGQILSLSTMRPINACKPLPIGQIVSYEDCANPTREGAIVSEPEHYGQRVIWLDGQGETHTTQNDIDGPGGWRLVGRMIDAAAVADLERAWFAHRTNMLRRQDEEFRQQQERDAAGKAWLAEHKPAWAKAVIMAELRQDVSDSHTDYFAGRTVRTVLLAWSKHTRDLFGEMRKAAARFEPTAHLVNAPESAEYRQKYSRGDGYYLTTGSRYHGWCVKKWPVSCSYLPAIAADPEARRLVE